jgi:gluconokinase
MTDYVIGVDIGTGSTKALAVNFKGQVIFSQQAHYNTATPAQGYSEQEPGLVWEAFVKCVSGITTAAQKNPAAIILSSAMHSVIPVGENGASLHPMITWADNRSADIARRIRQSAAGEMLYEQTGTPIHAMSPLCKIAWLREHDASLFGKTAKFISIKEYIWFNLFKTFETDHSIASATGLMDIETFTWSENALDTAGIQQHQLSSLVSTTYGRDDADPEVCAMLGVHPATRFIIGASDGCLANLGSFATAPGIAALTIGTSGAVRVASKLPVHNFGAMTFNYRLDEQTFICGGPSNNGGAVLKWFVESFLQKELVTAADYDSILNTITQTKAGAEGLIFLPYLFGERAPLWNSEASGLFFGIKNMHTQSHFTRAVVEGISMALYDIAENMMKSGLPISQVHVSGGFVRSSAWLQILANIFNTKICLINSDDASAAGAAYLGLKSLKIIGDHNTLMPETIKEILPQPECVALYQHNFKTYRLLYNNLREIWSHK